MKGGFVYILTNKPGGVLYIGATADLATRIEQHRLGKVFEFHEEIQLPTARLVRMV